MPFIEKHGGLWLDDPGDVKTQPIHEHFDPKSELFAVVVRSPFGHFVAALFEKTTDPQLQLPIWDRQCPETLFADQPTAVAFVESLLQAVSGT
jgi:hypothetical protein